MLASCTRRTLSSAPIGILAREYLGLHSAGYVSQERMDVHTRHYKSCLEQGCLCRIGEEDQGHCGGYKCLQGMLRPQIQILHVQFSPGITSEVIRLVLKRSHA